MCEVYSCVTVKLSLWISLKNNSPEDCHWNNFKIAVRFQVEELKIADVRTYQWFLP